MQDLSEQGRREENAKEHFSSLFSAVISIESECSTCMKHMLAEKLVQYLLSGSKDLFAACFVRLQNDVWRGIYVFLISQLTA